MSWSLSSYLEFRTPPPTGMPMHPNWAPVHCTAGLQGPVHTGGGSRFACISFDVAVSWVSTAIDSNVSFVSRGVLRKAQSTQDAGCDTLANSNVFSFDVACMQCGHPNSHQQVPFACMALCVASRVLCGLGLTALKHLLHCLYTFESKTGHKPLFVEWGFMVWWWTLQPN